VLSTAYRGAELLQEAQRGQERAGHATEFV
jgi:hypothetical protein